MPVYVCLAVCVAFERTLNTPDFEGAGGLSRWKDQSKQRWKSLLLLEEQLMTLFYWMV